MTTEPTVLDTDLQATLDEAKFTPRQMKVLVKILTKIQQDLQKSEDRSKKEKNAAEHQPRQNGIDWGIIGKHYDKITALEKQNLDLTRHLTAISTKVAALDQTLQTENEVMTGVMATQKLVQISIAKLLDDNARRNATLSKLVEDGIKQGDENQKLMQVLKNILDHQQKLMADFGDLFLKHEHLVRRLNEARKKLYLEEVTP